VHCPLEWAQYSCHKSLAKYAWLCVRQCVLPANMDSRFLLSSGLPVSNQSSFHSSLWFRLLQDLSAEELGVLCILLGILLVCVRRQVSRLCILRVFIAIAKQARWVIVALGLSYLGCMRLKSWASKISQLPSGANSDSWATNAWSLFMVAAVSCGVTLGLVGTLWAMISLGGSSAWFPKRLDKKNDKTEKICNQIYVTAPESLTTSIEKILGKEDDSANLVSVELEDMKNNIQKNAHTQKIILEQLSTLVKHIEGLHMMLPSANFLAFSLDEMSSRMEERLDDFAEIMNIEISSAGGNRREENIGKMNNNDKNEKNEKNEKKEKNEKNLKNEKNEKDKKDQEIQVDAESSDLESENETSTEEEMAGVNVVEGWKKTKNPVSKKKSVSFKPNRNMKSSLMPAASASAYSKMSEDELFEELQKKRRERREEARKPVFLTEEEQNLSVAALDKRWRDQEQKERALRRTEEEEELGVLTEEEKKLPKSELKFLIRRKKKDAWIRRMQDRNIPLFKCSVCGEITTSIHRCAATSWAIQGTKKLIPVNEEIIFQQTGTGDIRLKRIQKADSERVQLQYQALTEQLKKTEDENNRLKNLLSKPDSQLIKDPIAVVVENDDDHNMVTAVPATNVLTSARINPSSQHFFQHPFYPQPC
jgi:hypothetical protein